MLFRSVSQSRYVAAEPYATILQFFTTKETAKFIKTELGQYDLKILDQIRDVILHKKGNETLIITSSSMGETENGSTDLAKFVDEIIKSQSNKLGGMLLKTYDTTFSTTGYKQIGSMEQAVSQK